MLKLLSYLKENKIKIIAVVIIVLIILLLIVSPWNTKIEDTREYKKAEEKYHTSNEINVLLDNIREKTAIEVLHVNDSHLVITEEGSKSESQRWIEIPGSGVFTINLENCETIVDNENAYVLLRLQEPELSNVEIDYKNCKIYEYNFDGKAKYNSYSTGAEEAKDDLSEAYTSLKQVFYEDQLLYVSAKNSAEKLLTAIIKNLNPEIDVKVKIEWLSISNNI